MATHKETIFSNGSGTSSTFIWPGGRGVFLVEATFGGGNVKLQIQGPNGTFLDVPNSTLSAAGMSAELILPSGQYRALATTATGVYAELVRT